MAPTDEQVLGLVTATTDASGAIPADVYARAVLEAIYANRMLQGIVSFTEEDQTAEAGNSVEVGILAARTAQGPITEGNALTANASSITTVKVDISKYGDYDLVNKEVFEDQRLFDRAAFIRNMGAALAEKVDQLVYDQLETATPGSSSTLATAGTLTDLYDKVVDVKSKLKKAKRRPSHLIIGPDQEAQFLLDTDEGTKFRNINARDGELLSVAGLQVIVTPLANANVNTASEVQAIVIDASRAIAEAWGRRPNTVTDEVSRAEFDQVKLVTWLRYGTNNIEDTSIGHVTNP